MQRYLLSLFASLLCGLIVIAMAQGMKTDGLQTDLQSPTELVAGSSPQVLRGAELYSLNCAACHGNTASGLAEARLAFPEDHRNCESCHKPNNSPRAADIPNIEFSERNGFSLGEPPALSGEGVLQHFGNAATLYNYIQAAMPRWQPNNLAAEEYLDITAFLLTLNGQLPETTPLTVENAATLDLKD